MNVLCIADVCGSGGCNALLKALPKIKIQEKIDLTIVNGENSAEGNGILPKSAGMIFSAGADVITGGNHTLARKEIYPLLDSNPFILRPENIKEAAYGSGFCIVDMGYTSVAVINLLGNVFFNNDISPFFTADKLIKKAEENNAKIIICDFHAEATSEKKALAYYLDGRISALFGTHTHCITADSSVLPKGTGYITDLGFTGAQNSVLGVDKDISILKLKDNAQIYFKNAEGPYMINGIVFTIDNKTAECLNVKPIIIKNINA